MKKGCILWLIVILLATTAAFILVYRIIFVPSGININEVKYPIVGIDVSEHTGNIDFRKAKDHNIDFVFLKATEGQTYRDKTFEINYLGAKRNEIPIGTYHFFRKNRSGKVQALNFLSAIQGKSFQLPLVLDIEDWGNLSLRPNKDIIKEIAEFISIVESKTGKPMLIYTNESGYNTYIRGNFKKNAIWICSFRKKPNIDREWIFWQYSHKGKFDFADGWVDINTFHGGRGQFDSFLKKQRTLNKK